MVQQIEITLKPKRRGFHLVTMLKSKAIMVVATIVAACGGQKSPQNGGHDIGIDSAIVAQINAEDTDYVPQRSDYSFHSDVRVVNEDGEVRWDTIVVYLTDAMERQGA